MISLRASLNTGYITCTLHYITNPASSLSFSNNIIVVVVVVVNVIVKVFDVKKWKKCYNWTAGKVDDIANGVTNRRTDGTAVLSTTIACKS